MKKFSEYTFENFVPKRVEERKKDADHKLLAKKNNAELDLLIRSVRDFNDAYQTLTDIWHTTTQDQDTALGTEYPFERSFDEYDVKGWYESVKAKLEKLKM